MAARRKAPRTGSGKQRGSDTTTCAAERGHTGVQGKGWLEGSKRTRARKEVEMKDDHDEASLVEGLRTLDRVNVKLENHRRARARVLCARTVALFMREAPWSPPPSRPHAPLSKSRHRAACTADASSGGTPPAP
jgi:hypothetical protein